MALFSTQFLFWFSHADARVIISCWRSVKSQRFYSWVIKAKPPMRAVGEIQVSPWLVQAALKRVLGYLGFSGHQEPSLCQYVLLSSCSQGHVRDLTPHKASASQLSAFPALQLSAKELVVCRELLVSSKGQQVSTCQSICKQKVPFLRRVLWSLN